MTYELSRNQSAKEKDIRKKRTVALNAADEFEDEVENSKSKKEDELVLITREFKKILRRRENFRRRKPLNKGEPSKEKEKEKEYQITCYDYKKLGHYRHECPQLKKEIKNYKKRAMIAT